MYDEYEILYNTIEKHNGMSLAVVEYDPSSNKPFMVYQLNLDTLEYEQYSGEDTLKIAKNVADNF